MKPKERLTEWWDIAKSSSCASC